MPDEDLQLTLDGDGVPLGQLPTAGSFEKVADGVYVERDAAGESVQLHASRREGEKKISQIGPDDPWPEDFF